MLRNQKIPRHKRFTGLPQVILLDRGYVPLNACPIGDAENARHENVATENAAQFSIYLQGWQMRGTTMRHSIAGDGVLHVYWCIVSYNSCCVYGQWRGIRLCRACVTCCQILWKKSLFSVRSSLKIRMIYISVLQQLSQWSLTFMLTDGDTGRSDWKCETWNCGTIMKVQLENATKDNADNRP